MNDSKATAGLAKWSVPTFLNTRHGPIEHIESGEGAAVFPLHGAMGGYDQGQILVRAIWVRGIEISNLVWIRKVYLKDCRSFCTYPIVYLGK